MPKSTFLLDLSRIYKILKIVTIVYFMTYLKFVLIESFLCGILGCLILWMIQTYENKLWNNCGRLFVLSTEHTFGVLEKSCIFILHYQISFIFLRVNDFNVLSMFLFKDCVHHGTNSWNHSNIDSNVTNMVIIVLRLFKDICTLLLEVSVLQ
jgi:hypothetical protein